MMEKKDLLKKQKLAEELGMKFDEASELFSEETLETMRMINIMGGSGGGGIIMLIAVDALRIV